ncbi:MAG: roadblock/LC7 domain-containing protein [Verrucomicrobiota bacterium]
MPLATGDTIQLPLNDILSMLPGTLAPLVASRPGGTFQVPVNVVWEQIRSGAIRIPFGQLRQGAPAGTFSDDSNQDDSLIDLPLQQILAAIGPTALPRRTDQKRVKVPDEITGVFGAKGQPGRAVVTPARPTPQPKAPAAAPNPPAPAASAPASVAPKPPAPPPPKPPSPSASPKPAVPVTPPAAPFKPAPSIVPLPAAQPPPARVPLPFATARPASPAPASAAPVAPVAAPTSAADPLTVVIGNVCAAWPEAIRREVEQFNLARASVTIPMHRLEAAMKLGRVQFKWGELRAWFTPPLAGRSAQAETQVELPLNVIAPLFLARHRAAPARKRTTLGEDIPDLFAPLGKQAAPAGPAAPAAGPAPATAPSQPLKPAHAPNVLGEIFGKLSKSEWTPPDIAQAITALPGVAGAVIASGDGLLVAGHATAPVKGETVAAFSPQIFGRMAGFATEVQLGSLHSLTLNAGSAACALFKAGTLYLAVLGKPGEALPQQVLLRVAAELAKQSQI